MNHQKDKRTISRMECIVIMIRIMNRQIRIRTSQMIYHEAVLPNSEGFQVIHPLSLVPPLRGNQVQRARKGGTRSQLSSKASMKAKDHQPNPSKAPGREKVQNLFIQLTALVIIKVVKVAPPTIWITVCLNLHMSQGRGHQQKLIGKARRRLIVGMITRRVIVGMIIRRLIVGMIIRRLIIGMITRRLIRGMITKILIMGMITRRLIRGMITKRQIIWMITRRLITGMIIKRPIANMVIK